MTYDPGSNGLFPGTIITNMDQRVFNLCIEDMTNLLEDPETADFTLKCGSKSFKVHKNILGARSAVFRDMFRTGMREAVDGEAVIFIAAEMFNREKMYEFARDKLKENKGILVGEKSETMVRGSLQDHSLNLNQTTD